MTQRCVCFGTAMTVLAVLLLGAVVWHPATLRAQQPATSYAPVVMQQDFDKTVARMSAAKPRVIERHMKLLEERYDVTDRRAEGVAMSRGKPVQEGVRVKLPPGVKSWKELAAMSPEEICEKGVWPRGFLPLPHPNHPEGGMVFPKHHIYEIMKQEGRDLTRFDLDFDLPEHLLPEFPPPIYLTTRTDLGDVSQGQVVTLQNYFKLFNGMLNPKQLEGLRLLVTPFPQQQYNASCRNSARVILLPVVNEILSQIVASSSPCVFMMMLPKALTEGQRTIVHTWDILPGIYLSARAIDRAKAKEPCCLLSAHRSL